MNNRETIYFSNEEIETFDKLGLKRSDLKKLITVGILTVLEKIREGRKNSR